MNKFIRDLRHAIRGFCSLDQLRRNAGYALRQFRRNPVFTLAAVLTLALGIGMNTAFFSMYYQVLWRAIPVDEPDRLVNLVTPGAHPNMRWSNMEGTPDEVFRYPTYRELEKKQIVFTGIAAHRMFDVNLNARGEASKSLGMLVSGSYFSILGVRPALGRLLNLQDDRIINEPHVVVLSYDYWQTRFGGDRNVLNQTIIVNGQLMTIVGVAQNGFNGTTIYAKPQVFVPITMVPSMIDIEGLDSGSWHWAYLFARLKPGIMQEKAQASLNALYHAIIDELEAPLQNWMNEQEMAQFRTQKITLDEGRHGRINIPEEVHIASHMMFGITAFVWIIACANVTNLLLARGAARKGEMAVRLSIGANRRQIVTQLLTEYGLLAVFSGAAALLVAQWTVSLVAALAPVEHHEYIQFSLNTPVLLFAAAFTLATGLIFGLFPALHNTRSDLAPALKLQADRQSDLTKATRFRTSLSTMQIALSLALLMVAGFITKDLLNLSRVDLGMKVDNIVAFGISPSLNRYPIQRLLRLYEQLENELSALPGVTGVTSSSFDVLNQPIYNMSLSVEGYESEPGNDDYSSLNTIGAGYFRTLGIPLIAGREFARSDAAGAPKVAIVNEVFADKFNLGRDAVGKHFGLGRNGPLDIEIVGLVQNVKDVNGYPTKPLFFRPYRQEDAIGNLTFYIRTASNPDEILPVIRKTMARIDPNVPVENLRPLPQQVHESLSMGRFATILTAAFAGLAILLTAIGLYGVLAYTVAQRTREIGLRMALGASQAQVRKMILRRAGLMMFIGEAIGLVLGIGFNHSIRSLFYEFEEFDPVVLCVSAAVITLVALAAGFIPAYRASQVDPIQALRYE
jgi:predicted permease